VYYVTHVELPGPPGRVCVEAPQPYRLRVCHAVHTAGRTVVTRGDKAYTAFIHKWKAACSGGRLADGLKMILEALFYRPAGVITLAYMVYHDRGGARHYLVSTGGRRHVVHVEAGDKNYVAKAVRVTSGFARTYNPMPHGGSISKDRRVLEQYHLVRNAVTVKQMFDPPGHARCVKNIVEAASGARWLPAEEI